MALPTSPSSGEGQSGLLTIILAQHFPPLLGDALELARQIARGIAAELLVDAEMRRLGERRAAQAAMAEMKEVGAGETHQQRRMGGDDVLPPPGRALLRQHRHEFELAFRRECGFGLVEEIERGKLAAEAVLEEGEERLAMAALVQAPRAPGFFRGEGILAIGALDIVDEVEEALGAKEEAIRHLGQQGEVQRGGEAVFVAVAAIEIVPAAAARVEAGLARDRLQEARLAGAVLADEKGHRMGEVEREAAAPHEGQGEGKTPVLPALRDLRDATQEGRGEPRARIGTGRAIAGHARLPYSSSPLACSAARSAATRASSPSRYRAGSCQSSR